MRKKQDGDVMCLVCERSGRGCELWGCLELVLLGHWPSNRAKTGRKTKAVDTPNRVALHLAEA